MKIDLGFSPRDTAPADALVWIPHDGEPNPVREGETLVGLRFRNGETTINPDEPSEYDWSDEGVSFDITHYAVTPPRVAAPVTEPAPMSADEVLIRAREAMIEAYKRRGETAAKTRRGDDDSFAAIKAIIAYERDRAKPLAEVALHTVEDADLVEARKLVAAQWPESTKEFLSGDFDSGVSVTRILAAIKRGRELERGE